MKLRKINRVIGIISCFLFAFGLLVAVVCIVFPNKNVTAFIAAISVSGAGLVGFVITSILYATSSKERKLRWRRYAAFKPLESIDFKSELDAVRKNYAADNSPEKNHIEKLPKNSGGNALDDYGVLQSGKIYYAHLVMANSALFKRSFFRATYPGVVVYSPDEYFEGNPYELKKIAAQLYKNRANNLLRDERATFTNVRIKHEREVYVTVLPIYRMHVPFKVLYGGLFPVIADPNGTATFVVDEKYWTDALGSNFVYGDRACHDDEPFGELNGWIKRN